MNVFDFVHCDASEYLLRETANLLDVQLLGELRPRTGCSMAKGFPKPIIKTTKSPATRKIRRTFVDLSGPNSLHSLSQINGI